MMKCNIVAPNPLPRCDGAVRIDFSSTCSALSRFIAPQPTNESSSQTDQKVISGFFSRPSRARVCFLAVTRAHIVEGSSKNSAIRGSLKSSIRITIFTRHHTNHNQYLHGVLPLLAKPWGTSKRERMQSPVLTQRHIFVAITRVSLPCKTTRVDRSEVLHHFIIHFRANGHSTCTISSLNRY